MVQFIDLWRGHPINESVTTPCIAPHELTNMEGEHVSMGFPVFHNQCAIRLGVALRRAGVPTARSAAAPPAPYIRAPTCISSTPASSPTR